ncbi:hypothetical protein [Amycolatopsis sp. H20-H5]|uniref:hypothetical protein n=1 Tax=Amycolatopsis sp. H20-H5 TaxID=3046309 RepID=UPI002DBA10AD|nr:hypothetical protein [Amycolatopsis sp. H20-H5]MEC3976160.1 hypothetical protein [Amycolatopsis sp. H20-H5]
MDSLGWHQARTTRTVDSTGRKVTVTTGLTTDIAGVDRDPQGQRDRRERRADPRGSAGRRAAAAMTVVAAAPNRQDTGDDYTVRYYTAHGGAHEYLKRELADPSFSLLIPWCQATQLLAEHHVHSDVDNQPLSKHTRFQVCRGCREARNGSPT